MFRHTLRQNKCKLRKYTIDKKRLKYMSKEQAQSVRISPDGQGETVKKGHLQKHIHEVIAECFTTYVLSDNKKIPTDNKCHF